MHILPSCDCRLPVTIKMMKRIFGKACPQPHADCLQRCKVCKGYAQVVEQTSGQNICRHAGQAHFTFAFVTTTLLSTNAGNKRLSKPANAECTQRRFVSLGKSVGSAGFPPA